ncbi:MAG: phosphoribosylformylglycinamidine synthase, partial [Capsulimonas sp.]|nr:phosphoribosylformylglycinamidine synthase [Capsulimonas sp.]
EVAAIFHKWGLNAVVVGEVTDTGRVVILDNGVVAADVPSKSLTDDCPTYTLAASEPTYIGEVQGADLNFPEPDSYTDALLTLLGTPSIASKRWVYDQYDSMVQTQTTVLPGDADAAVIRIRETNKAIALTTDCNPRYCYLDPYVGAQIAVAEAARNLSCVGATPLAVTDCLNFANPEKADNFWTFRRCVEGLADACEALGTPVISGNVSFYNETPERAIFPTPTIGMVGLIEESEKRLTMGFKANNDKIFLVSLGEPTLGGSEYLAQIHNLEVGKPPTLDLSSERAVQTFVREAIGLGLLQSAHDLSDGGLAVALAECCFSAERGAQITATADARLLFGERTASILLSVAPDRVDALLALATTHHLDLQDLGIVGGTRLTVRDGDTLVIDAEVKELQRRFEDAIPNLLAAGAV